MRNKSREEKGDYKNFRVALAGNPNVGKSTLFNLLTGMKQHTGNWAGKTVSNATGVFKKENKSFTFVDLPGTYSLMSNSPEEEIARDYLCFENPDAVVVVCDATCLERGLNLVLQITEISRKVMVCVNLLDEAEKKGIKVNIPELSRKLGVPVVGISAGKGMGVKGFLSTLEKLIKSKSQRYKEITYKGEILKALEILTPAVKRNLRQNKAVNPRFVALKILEKNKKIIDKIKEFVLDEFGKEDLKSLEKAEEFLAEKGINGEVFEKYLVSAFILTAEEICSPDIITETLKKNSDNGKLDKILTGKITGSLVMILFLALIFWLTVYAANYPSDLLWNFFQFLETKLIMLSEFIRLPRVISDMLILGIYRVLTWVISVMLPPMAIFFPIFTLLEDFGLLPRIAFNLDRGFKGCSGSGKQALTMCMGFGCNAVGITGCRIIGSKRERLIAMLTNSFVPCNGRFPTLIAMIGMFLAVGFGTLNSFISATILTLTVLFAVAVTFLASKLLSVTLLRGESSSFVLELPPFRKPKFSSVIVRSVLDRTVFVLLRAVSVAAPAGLVIWIMANVTVGGNTLLFICSEFLDPLGKIMGLDGVILLGFILGFPANEIVIPIIIMAYMSSGSLSDYGSLAELKNLLVANGWTVTTAISVMIFSVMHWPCIAALTTIKKESGSFKWALVGFLLPTLFGVVGCILFNLIF